MEILQKIESWRGKPGQAFGAYLYKIKTDQHLTDQLESLTQFLEATYPKETISAQQRFYHVWFDFYEIEQCPYCGSPRIFSKVPKFSIDRYGISPTNSVNYYGTCLSSECSKKYNLERTRKSLLSKYGTYNIMEIPGALEKIKETNRRKYGCDFYTCTQEFKNKTNETFKEKYGGHPTKLKVTQDKRKKTNLEKYGFENPLNNLEIKEKSIKTNNEKYGGNSSMCSDEIKEKSKKTNRSNHGVDWYVQSDDFKKKFRDTMLDRYGVEHAFHYTPFFDRSLATSYQKKIFIFPSGRLEKIQGYEGFALNDLLDLGYLEEDIVVSNLEIENCIGRIWYFDPYDERNKKYYPDIYIKSENKIIEVKSDYTYNSGYSRNILKKNACLSMGLLFEFWIYDQTGQKFVK